MADQYQYAGLAQAGQAPGYPQFQYPTASGDQNAPFLQGYALAQQGGAQTTVPAAMFGGQSVGSFGIDQSQVAYSQAAAGVPVPQIGASQMPINAGIGAGFPYGDYSQFNQYGSIGPGVGGMPQSIGDMQQFGQLLPNAFNQTATRNLYDAFAQDQGLAGFNPAAFLQDPTGSMGRNLGGFSGKGFGMNQRGGMNKFGNGGRSNALPSVTNPDGLREDTIFVSKLPQNIDHDVMKAQFGVIGKIKINSKTGMPMIWIFKERGVPKGDALVTYEDPNCVQAAIKWFAEHEFLGKKIDVKQAKNSQRPVIITPGGGGGGSGAGGNMMNNAAALAAAAVAAAASGNTMSSLMNNSAAAAASLAALTGGAPYGMEKPDMNIYGQLSGARDGRNISAPNRPGGNATGAGRAGDWVCASCHNVSFSWRDRCKQCNAPRPDDMNLNAVGGMGRGCPPGMGPGRGGSAVGGVGGIPVVGSNGTGGMGRGTPGNLQSNMASTMRGGRGGGPMRGSAVSAGRMRPAPY
uniref:Transcription initiation factor TFIID subunit 15 n=1 Tax=Schistocephalus solidus TaxID=70667 RepID=A0A0X3PII7_SCHSO